MANTSSTQFGTLLIWNTLIATIPTTKKMQAKKEFLDCVAKMIGNSAIATAMYNARLDDVNKNEE